MFTWRHSYHECEPLILSTSMEKVPTWNCLVKDFFLSNPYFMEIDTAARFFECILLVFWTLQGKCHLILITRRNISNQESLASYRVITGPRKAYLFNVTAPFTFFFLHKDNKKIIRFISRSISKPKSSLH